MDRVFLDANVLFSASYRESNGLLRLWQLNNVLLLSSKYALHEARVNLQPGAQRKRLERLSRRTKILANHPVISIPEEINLPAKDQPILQAAIGAKANFLLTGDFRHFGPLFEGTIGTVRILKPSAYLTMKEME